MVEGNLNMLNTVFPSLFLFSNQENFFQKLTKLRQGAGKDGGGVGSSSHLVPPAYLDNFQIILKTFEFNLRFKERTAGMLQRGVYASNNVGRWKKIKNKQESSGGGAPARSQAKAGW